MHHRGHTFPIRVSCQSVKVLITITQSADEIYSTEKGQVLNKPDFICALLFISPLVAAADDEPDEKQEQQQKQDGTDYCPRNDTCFIGS